MVEEYRKAFKMALKVDFLKGKEEITAYAMALYMAMEWGRCVK